MTRLLISVMWFSMLATGCAYQLPIEPQQRIVGLWILDQSVLGERTQELLSIHADGSFDAKVLFENRIGMVAQFVEQGEWTIAGNEVEFVTKKRNGKVFSPSEAPWDQRVIKQLNNDVLVVADKKFGIELQCQRAPDGYSLPGWNERLMKNTAK